MRTLPTTFELLSGGVEPDAPGARGPGGGRARPRAGARGDRPRRRLPARPGRARHRRRAARSAPSCAARSPACGPKLLVLVEHAENALFEIRRELEEERHFARTVAVLADCKDATRMREVFAEHAPAVVFHAAAYKHVPLMEENPVEAVRNNAVATRIVAAAAGEAGVERFVLVSTDKAVSPATVMGASKALAEWAVEAAQNRWTGHALRVGALRQRARLVGLGGADLPPPDRAGRAGDGHRPADDALLHDDPRGGPADHPLGRAGHGRRGLRARDGRPGEDRRPGAQHDPAGRARAGRGHRDRDRRAAGPARRSTRSCSTPASARSRRPPRRSSARSSRRSSRSGSRARSRASRSSSTRGDAAALAGAVAELSAERALAAAPQRS